MKDREFENYLALLSGMLRLRRTQREGIAGELRDHLIEHVAHLEASGIAHEEAVRRALEEFGDAAALAANFQALVGMRRRRLVMRCTIGTTVVMTGLVVAMLAFRPPVIDDPSIVKAQAGGQDSKTTKGKAQGKSGNRLASDDGGARQRLQINKIDAEFIDLPVQDALAFLSDRIGVQFHIDKQSLENASTNSDTPVTLRLQNVPAEMVLDLILRQAKLGYRLRNGVILVASAEDVQSQTEVRVYRVPEGMAEELAALIPDTIDAQLWSGHTVIIDSRGRRRAGFGSMGAGPSGGGYGEPGYGSSGGYGGATEATELVGGGGAGTIRVFRGTLVISQTPEVHQKIEKLLTDLDGAGAMDPQRRPDGPGGERSGLMPGGNEQRIRLIAQSMLSRYDENKDGILRREEWSKMPNEPEKSDTNGDGQITLDELSERLGAWRASGPSQEAIPGQSGSGYGTTGRGGYGSTGGSRGGYGSTTGRGGYGATGRAGADHPGYGRTPASSPAAEGVPGQTPSRGGSAPPDSPSGTPGASATPGVPPSGPTDPNAAGSGPASGTGLFAPEPSAPGASAAAPSAESNGTSAPAPTAGNEPASGTSAPSRAPAGAYGGAK